ncbi:beta-ketoacyl-[acyl-carrier-protein] synthase family protein [Jeotgalibacillus proteolyticus]|uniref:Beta-ketoacyl-[acyl-carrier-protein] synthase II n=1 Tax=Jeotgalibacillus proteolyticus TaxID=2082395 RepID=A0A2S5G767_9BACL|nr:beta-ketoacyl-[acyl-carrier-protein] synthase family protein [Jeotgalibacillus proteolyticus]PPA68716.1 beta-ketoacyl-[acyl-carrier-protein] synthase II [Jeotgalibacillus proteolyticus]PPA68793.1 beta-ketoacyl-[acyl-carrier-protein] synthase II [Jeotgalibacillus proteolyticus]
MDKKRVVVTGMGMVSPCGDSVEKVWDKIINGDHLFSKLDSKRAKETSISLAGEIPELNTEEYFSKREARKMDKFVQYAMIASTQAIKDAKLNLDSIDNHRFGVIIGSQFGGVHTWEEQMHLLYDRGPKKVSPFFIPMMIVNMATGQVSMNFGAKGPNNTPVTGMCSGSNAIGDAYNQILNNSADIMLCGGSDAAISSPLLGGYMSQGLVSNKENGNYICQPFTEESSGFVMSEGSGVLLLESLDHAKERNADIYCEIVGYGSSIGLDKESATPSVKGMVTSVESALMDAQLDFKSIQYINASGIGVASLDSRELDSLKSLLEKYEHDLHISSLKSVIGNFMGASGAIDSIISINTLHHDLIPCDVYPSYESIDSLILDQEISESLEYVLNNTIDLSGFNTSLIFKRWRDNE